MQTRMHLVDTVCLSLTLCVVVGVFGAATTPKTDGWRRFRRKTKVSDGPEPAVGPRSPTVYDWFVLGPRSVSFLVILPPP
jgi:hypothetical protein